MILSITLSVNNFLVRTTNLAPFPEGYLAFGFFDFIALEIVFATSSGSGRSPCDQNDFFIHTNLL